MLRIALLVFATFIASSTKSRATDIVLCNLTMPNGTFPIEETEPEFRKFLDQIWLGDWGGSNCGGFIPKKFFKRKSDGKLVAWITSFVQPFSARSKAEEEEEEKLRGSRRRGYGWVFLELPVTLNKNGGFTLEWSGSANQGQCSTLYLETTADGSGKGSCLRSERGTVHIVLRRRDSGN